MGDGCWVLGVSEQSSVDRCQFSAIIYFRIKYRIRDKSAELLLLNS